MQSTLEKEDLTAIAKEVSKLLAPKFKESEKSSVKNTFFDIDELVEYLRLPKTWIYRQTSDGTIPFYRIGRYLRFKKSEIDKNTTQIEVGSDITYDDMIEYLDELKYEHEKFVTDPGYYAVRGSIIDFWSYSEEHPCRLEFDGDFLESIRLELKFNSP